MVERRRLLLVIAEQRNLVQPAVAIDFVALVVVVVVVVPDFVAVVVAVMVADFVAVVAAMVPDFAAVVVVADSVAAVCCGVCRPLPG